MPLGELRELDAEHLAGRGCLLDDALLLEGLDRGDAGRARERMAAVRQAAREVPRARPLRDRLAHDHRAERDVARVDALGDRQDVRHDVPVVDREPLAGAAEAGHHLVADQQDPVPVARLADRLQVAVGRDDHAVRAGDRLEDHGRDRLAAPRTSGSPRGAARPCRPGTDPDGRPGSGRCTGRTSARRPAAPARPASGADRPSA